MHGEPETSQRNLPEGASQLQAVNEALSATLDPRVSNDVRKQALQHLEDLKKQPDAPHFGFLLAEDLGLNEAVRYYGLQLLEHAVRYRWSEYSDEQTAQLRTWVQSLVGKLREQDASYIRSKTAQIWAEVAKRCWGDEWMDMDALLVALWDEPVAEKGAVNKILVLLVLETLSEDIVNSEDAVAGLRLDVLGNALNEIMVPPDLHRELAQVKNGQMELRCGQEGWLARVCEFFALCVKQMRMEASPALATSMCACALTALKTLRPTMSWINLRGAVEVNCIDCLFLPFHTQDVALRTASLEVLYTLLNRPYPQQLHDWWISLFQQSLTPERIRLLQHAFGSTQSAPGQDDEKYTMQKKLAEVLSLLADAVAAHAELMDADKNMDFSAFLDLLQTVLQSRSLTVSIPILHSFTRLIDCERRPISDLVNRAFGTLIQTCSTRMIKYEALGEDAQDETAQFLFEDFDTMPERHAFLGNYRRYCVNIIQTIASLQPQEALTHVLEQMKSLLRSGPYTGARGFDSASYSKNSPSVLQFDAQFQVVSSALKGYSMWVVDLPALLEDSPENEQQQHPAAQLANKVTSLLQHWCYDIINSHTDDPEVAAQILATLVLILQTVKPEPDFVLQIVQHLLTMRLYDNPAHTTFSDAVRSFEGLRVVELQKLALAFSNELLEVYHELEPRVGVLVQKHANEPRLLWGYRAFLFMIIHRATAIENEQRMSRLQAMLKPVYDAWQDPSLNSSLSNLDTFCASLGMGDLANFYQAYGFDRTADWSSTQLDDAGQARQAEIKAKLEALPLRMTKALLAVSTEKLRAGSDAYETSCALWSSLIPVLLPRLLEMLRLAQSFYQMSNWAQLPPELQAVVKRTLQDRFWQSGISNESKDEFYARITGSKTSYEGFASAVRGTMRTIREQGYHILYLLGKFEEQFYGLSELAVPLAEALFKNADALSATHSHPIINLSTGMVQQCPPHHRARFLPPLLMQLFTQLDRNISGEWDAINDISQTNRQDDALNDEMRTESVLRQLTYSLVSFVTFLLHFDRPRPQSNGHAVSEPTLRDLVLFDPAVLEPLILFCTHALRVRDTRCCVTVCRVFRGIVPTFAGEDAPAPQVREFICTEVLKAAITSLNEPYFADMQKDLAMLIAQIIVYYAPATETPRSILLSLPAMSANKVDRTISKICKSSNERQQRALVLDLLEGVRGISIHEQGKIAKEPKKTTGSNSNKTTSMMQQHYMDVEARPTIVHGDESGLDSVAGLFGDS